ncbi:MAG: PHP domain-containing protein [Clostridia bacterium]|nr:PHP domain-containing protein [Clostridia bacterium]
MSQKEKMHSCELYLPGDAEIMAEQTLCLDKLYDYNTTRPTEGAKREALLSEMFAEIGEGCYIEPPLHSNWGGRHCHFGKNVYANFNLTLVDDTHIYVGDGTMFAPNVVIATAGHPILPELRAKGFQYNAPVHIGKNCWLGAGVLVMPGVSIGDNTVIGAGSVVTKDIPAGVIAVGNPCRVMRPIGEKDREFYFKERKIDYAEPEVAAAMPRLCDLHTHSSFSDGSLTPTELVAEAVRKGLCAVALTDHNTPSGLPEFCEAAEKADIEAVPGIEFSTDFGENELHIVGLFIKPEHYEAARTLALRMRESKLESHRILIERLAAAGYALDYEEIRKQTPRGNINRVNFAHALLEKGYVRSVDEAFEHLLAKDGGFYDEPPHLPVFEVLDFLSSIGAVSVLAHPFLSFKTEADMRAFLPEAKAHGLCAMETVYSKYSEETAARARAIAHEFGLLHSGGSDFHGKAKPGIALGTGEGNLAVPMELLEALRKEAK